MTLRGFFRHRVRAILLGLTALGSIVAAHNLFRDTSELGRVGASLGRHSRPLDGTANRVIGNFVEHLAVRTAIEAGATMVLLAMAAVLVCRMREEDRVR